MRRTRSYPPGFGHTKASGHLDGEVAETRSADGIEGFAEGFDSGGNDGLTAAVDPLQGAEVEGALQLGSSGGKVLGKLRDEEVRGERQGDFL